MQMDADDPDAIGNIRVGHDRERAFVLTGLDRDERHRQLEEISDGSGRRRYRSDLEIWRATRRVEGSPKAERAVRIDADDPHRRVAAIPRRDDR